MKITLEAKPLSINKAFQGRRFKTKDYKSYEQEIIALLTQQEAPRVVFEGRVGVRFIWHLKYAKTSDLDNFVKPLCDILVKKGVLSDD